MGTELVGPCVEDDSLEIPSIPPGFESLVPFTLKRVVDNHTGSYPSSATASELQTVKVETVLDANDDSKAVKSLRRRPGIKYSQFDYSSGDEYESEQHPVLRHQLPKGVIRGCEECRNCQKVTAKWHPEEARRPNLEDAPVFYPSEEEFEDTLKYISSIRTKAEKYGICRIVPPPSWKPPCPLKERNMWENSKFTTRVQRVDKLQNRYSMRKVLQVNNTKRRKKRRCMRSGGDSENCNEEIQIPVDIPQYEAEWFGFEPGPEFTLGAFQKYADDFKEQYFRNKSNSGTMLEEQWQPSVEHIEGEYWRMVEKPTEEIEVLYGADLETGVFGSGFPKNLEQVGAASDMKYISSGWNLNNFPRLPGSVLSFESSDISGVLVPWLYIGMCFSSFCWHVEDHHLYSLNFMHWGAPKIWYGVPGSDALKLEAAMRKHLPDLFEEQPDLLHKLVTQLSPSILQSEGVPVYRCVQNPGEFVLTFPRSYHAGFNSGFNCAEAVNVAPVDWLPHGQNAIELYREQGRKTSISHDKLLLGAAREAVKANWEFNLLRKSTSNILRWKDVCGKDGILSKALKSRVEMERVRREFLCKSSQALKMESSFDANSERECSVCLFDLHLSAAGCHHCSPSKYACLNHAKQLCSCSWGAKFFLFRYDINELNILVEALEGKLSAVYRWARLDLGLALSSYVSKDNMQILGKSSSYASQPKEMTSLPTIVSSKKQDNEDILNSKNSGQKNPPIVVLALENTKTLLHISSQKIEGAKKCPPCKKERSLQPIQKIKAPSSSQLSQVNNSLKIIPSTQKLASEKPQEKPENKDVILLSDDEGDEPTKKPPSVGNMTSVVSSTNSPDSTSTAVALERMKHGSSSECIKVEDDSMNISATLERIKHGSISECIKVEDNSMNISCFKSDADSSKDVSGKKETSDGDEDGFHKPQIHYEKPSCNADSRNNVKMDVDSRSMDNPQTTSTGSQNILDRFYRQKGPRIAKVVRRINCNVEPLEFGAVCAGKLWCDSRAIYPKGFRSRVRYIDVVDPSNMCYYISEILDAGRDRPLFMVSVEHSPSEVFVHVSPMRCWEMVRERVNNIISKKHKLGREKLPPLQPPGSLDGMEMFGFSSPEIVQVIQGMDQNRVCTEYWKSRPLMKIPQQSLSTNLKSEPLNNEESHPGGIERVLNGLFNKANPEELRTLYTLLNNTNSTHHQSLIIRLLNQEINRHPK